MKVRVALNVEVDAEEWAGQYGCGTSARAVAEDVRAYVLYQIQESPAPTVSVTPTR